MRLGVIGERSTHQQEIVKYGKKMGYSMLTLETPHRDDASPHFMDKLIKQADAIICVLNDDFHEINHESNKLIHEIVTRMHGHDTKRILVASPLNNSNKILKHPKLSILDHIKSYIHTPYSTKLDILAKSSLDWTVIGFQNDGDNIRTDEDIAKIAITRLTDAKSLNTILMV